MNKYFSSLEELKKNISKNPKTVLVHCHGVFDLLHIGHLNYFKEAKKLGNKLLVSITADQYVNKGIYNPHFDQITRAEVLANINIIDYVYINNSKTAVNLIKNIKPNFYVKGPDYKNVSNDKNLSDEMNAIRTVGGKIYFTSGQTSSSSLLINKYSNNLDQDQKNFLNKIKNKYNFEKITNYISSLSKLKVLIIGEIIIDEYVYGKVIGKSGKEPVLVTKKISSSKFAGGTIAVANHISSFCKEVKVLSYKGSDNINNNFIKKNLQKNVKIETILKKDSPSIIKTRFIDNYSKNKLYSIYNINDENLTKDEEIKFIKIIDKNIHKYDMVAVVDYGHGLLTDKVIKNIEKKSKKLSVNSQLNSFNSSFYSHSKYKKVDYFCIHDGELRHGFRERYLSTKELIKKLYNKLKVKKIVITLGKEGSICFNKNQYVSCPAFVTNPIDTVGAGDALFGITAACFSKNIPSDITILIGNLVASKSTTKLGTGNFISKDDLTNYIKYLLN